MDSETQPIVTADEGNDVDLWTRLPVEIIDLFLLYLPVKSLLRFRAVCNRWKAMISDPKFAIKHLRTSMTTSDDFCSLVIRRSHAVCEFGYASNHSIFSNPNNFEFVNFLPFAEHEERDMTRARVSASCNGLVVLQFGDYERYLWNPATRETRKLPPVPWNQMYLNIIYRSVGFAYDEVNDDYKVAVFFAETQHDEYRALCAIYSLRCDEWRLLDVPDRIDNDTNSTMVLNGAFHWITCDDNVNSRRYIVALDLASGETREIALPDYGPNRIQNQRLWIFEGCLCVIALGNYSSTYDFWVMKDYGVVESWTSLFQVPCLRITYFDGRPELFLWGSRDGKLLIWFLSSWIVFDTKKQYIITGSPSPNNTIKPVVSYVESLVSPNRV